MVIYMVRNKISGKIYIGQTKNSVKKRWKEHKRKPHGILKYAFSKYKESDFEFNIIRKCNSIEEMNHYEELLIKNYQCMAPKGYNIREGGKNRYRSPKERLQVSKRHKGKVLSEEHKEALHSSRKGQKESQEIRLKRSKIMSGKTKTLNHRKKLGLAKSIPVMGISESGMGWYFLNPKLAELYGFSYDCIKKCCLGKHKQHKGFKWTQVKGL